MLEGLDAIDWASLEHAYGPATDVPDQLRALAIGDEAVCEGAIGKLSGNIYHQGTVYEATVYAVPFLIEIFVESSSQARISALILLSHIAHGYPFLGENWGLQHTISRSPEGIERDTVIQKQTAEYLSAARSRVGVGLEHYIRALGDPDHPIRVYAPYLLASFSEYVTRTVPRLWQVVDRDGSGEVHASAILALSHLVGGSDDAIQRFKDLLVSSEPELVQLTASIALAHVARARIPTIAVNWLCAAALFPKRHMTWRGYNPWRDECDPMHSLELCGPEILSYASRVLSESAQRLPSKLMGHVLRRLISMHFSQSFGRTRPPASLSSPQRVVVALLTQLPQAWEPDVHLDWMLEPCGLPLTRERMWEILLAADGVGMN